RCLYHWIAYPDVNRVADIIRRRVPSATSWLASRVAVAVARLRGLGLTKPPGVAEAINWANALHVLGVSDMDSAAVESTLGVVVKYAEDADTVRAAGFAPLVSDG
ncbi:MAG TPA: MoxR family ATPase, partial [Pseudonocardiaceae bacterium]|nr:MoxR family ATPase [Pseudonocardiaceae bacterium]